MADNISWSGVSNRVTWNEDADAWRTTLEITVSNGGSKKVYSVALNNTQTST